MWFWPPDSCIGKASLIHTFLAVATVRMYGHFWSLFKRKSRMRNERHRVLWH
jgi:hypothetical protein